MVRATWETARKKHLICVDSYDERILQGRIHTPQNETHIFSSLAQLLLIIENGLDESEASAPAHAFPGGETVPLRKGRRATFELQVLFRQHSSWQGILKWREKKLEQSFRSALELILLMDSALSSTEEA